MKCCTPQNQPREPKDDPTATTVDRDTEVQDMAAFTQKCQDMFTQPMADCCAQMSQQNTGSTRD